MPVIIENVSTTMNIQNEDKIRLVVRDEIERALNEQARTQTKGQSVDPADPAAAGSPE